MIKGVNKNIIEVNDPDSIYFEKAVFYLRPHIRRLPEEISREEIKLYLADAGLSGTVSRRRRRKIPLIAGALLIAAAVIIIAL